MIVKLIMLADGLGHKLSCTLGFRASTCVPLTLSFISEHKNGLTIGFVGNTVVNYLRIFGKSVPT